MRRSDAQNDEKGSQFGSDGFNRLRKDSQRVPSMGRRGNCWDTQSTISLSAAFSLARAGIGVIPLR